MGANDLQVLADRYLNEAAVRQFDAILAKHRNRIVARNAILAACLMALIAVVPIYHCNSSAVDISTNEIMETMQIIEAVGGNDIKYISVKPRKNKIVVTVNSGEGSEKSFLMRMSSDGSLIELMVNS